MVMGPRMSSCGRCGHRKAESDRDHTSRHSDVREQLAVVVVEFATMADS
jgi:hypothetical protein